ncbi:MAG: redoxin domain-containing protein [Bacteroidetes bacterium]|nr:redoxin domain-containing protein [Bacteroidota bacterium]
MFFKFSFAEKPKYTINVKIDGLKDTVCYLGNYYGDKQYIKDTAKIDSKGNCVFSGDDVLPGGIYLIIVPSKKYFEFIINNDMFFSMETDTSDFINDMKIKGSPENQLFYDYFRFINIKQKENEAIKTLYPKVKENKDSTKLLQDKLVAIDKAVQKYKLDFIDKHPETFLAKVFKASYELPIPEAPLLPNGKKDSVFVYRYYKQHFLDNIDFSDDRLLRTPIFHNKLKQYITTLVVQHPDSIIKDGDSLIAKAHNKEVFKYLVWYLTNWSETSNIMGFDAIFVHLVEKYYDTNQAYWVSPTNLEKISNRAKILKGLLLGVRTPNLTMQDTSDVFVTLYNLKSKYTVLYFWDPVCGHCQKETPVLKALYDSIKSNGVEVYAVCTDPKIDEWKKFIIKNSLNWINVMDIQNTTGFHTIYDIYSTPVIYLLDENKKILAKRLSVEQLRDFIERQIKIDEKKK